MSIIKCIAEKIEEELEDAKAYIELAMKWKSEYPETAELFNDLSGEEMGHVDILHRAVTGLIDQYRAKHGEPPKDMMTYAIGLTPIKLHRWLIITGTARLPSVLTSTLCADAVAGGDYSLAAFFLALSVLMALAGLWLYRRSQKKEASA